MELLKKGIWGIITLIFFPLFLLLRSLNSKRQLPVRIGGALLSLFVLFPLWLLGAVMILVVIIALALRLGLVSVPQHVTGQSMLPTIVDGSTVLMKRYEQLFYKPKIERGAIITFSNDRTKELEKNQGRDNLSFIKRVIAVEGDMFEIKNGYVYVNGKSLTEPYIFDSRSTFGHEDIVDCEKITVPKGKLLVLGDNRKKSSDSRDVGLVDINDIESWLSYNDQSAFKSRFRDTSGDLTTSQSSFFDPLVYTELLNAKRANAGLSAFKLSSRLSKSALLRAQAILRSGDSSYEATKSAYPMSRSMADAGYSNIISAEHIIFGYYNAEELEGYVFESAKNAEFYLNGDYQDIGVATLVGEFNGCPVQIVVQQLGGYVPPNYSFETINSWKQAVNRLKEIQPSWEKAKSFGKEYEDNKQDYDRIVEIIRQRIGNISAIVSRMEANEWLTLPEKQYIESDKALSEEQSELATQLNKP